MHPSPEDVSPLDAPPVPAQLRRRAPSPEWLDDPDTLDVPRLTPAPAIDMPPTRMQVEPVSVADVAEAPVSRSIEVVVTPDERRQDKLFVALILAMATCIAAMVMALGVLQLG